MTAHSLRVRQNASAYNAYAAAFATHSDGDRAWVQPLIAAFRRVVPAGGLVLDAGCANGREMADLAEAGYRVAGLDIAPTALRLAAERLPAADLVCADAVHLPFAGATFDGVWATASLLHLAPAEARLAVQEIARVLRPGGGLYCSLQRGDFRGLVPGRAVQTDLYYCYWQTDAWLEVIRAAGLVPRDVWETDWNPSCNAHAEGWLNITAVRPA